MTTKEDIKNWIDNAPKGSTHMIIVCDTFAWEDYPVYIKKGENVKEIERGINGKSMQRVMEVYNLKKSIKKQLSKNRSFTY